MTTVVRFEAISANNFIDLLLEQIQNNKKMNVKECFLIWLSTRLHEVEQNTARLSLRDSIDWSYDPESKENLTNASARGNKFGPEYVEARLKEILAKEQNPKIKSILRQQFKKFEDVQIKGQGRLELPKILPNASKKAFKKPVEGAASSKTHEPLEELPKRPIEKKPPAPSFEETDKKSLLNYSIVRLNSWQDSTNSFGPLAGTGISQLRDLINRKNLFEVNSIQSVLTCLQNMDETATTGIATALLDKILSEVLSFSCKISLEDLTLLDKFLVGVLINVLVKTPRLEHAYHLVIFRILLNAPTPTDSDCSQRAKVIDEMVRSKGMNYILSVLQGLYNEVKYNMSVELR